MQPEEEVIRIYPRRSRLVLLILGSLLFVVAGAWMLRLPASSRAKLVRQRAIGVASIAFFGLAGAYASWRMLRPRPLVELDAQGLVDSASLTGVGRLAWDEIEAVVPYRFRGQAMLGIVPRDLDALLARQGTLPAKALQANLALGCAPINIPQVTLPMKVEELAALITERYGVPSGAER